MELRVSLLTTRYELTRGTCSGARCCVTVVTLVSVACCGWLVWRTDAELATAAIQSIPATNTAVARAAMVNVITRERLRWKPPGIRRADIREFALRQRQGSTKTHPPPAGAFKDSKRNACGEVSQHRGYRWRLPRLSVLTQKTTQLLVLIYLIATELSTREAE